MARCEQAEYDAYFGECICRKYDLPCRVACRSCTKSPYK